MTTSPLANPSATRALLETYGKQVDFTDLSALAPIVREILRG